MRDTFCRHCGARHLKTWGQSEGSQHCMGCERTTFHNPLPVAVILQPVVDPDAERAGLLVGLRAGCVHASGQWGLPGGFMELGDADTAAAAFRELREETGLGVEMRDPPTHVLWNMSDGRHLVIFVESLAPIRLAQLSDFQASTECSEVRTAWAPEELAFPSHTEAMRRWFDTGRASDLR